MENFNNQIIALRKLGKTYTEIQMALGKKIPKSTLSYWCQGVKMPKKLQLKIKQKNLANLGRARILALQSKKDKKEAALAGVRQQSFVFRQLFKDRATSKLLLAILYACEGSRSKNRSSLMFGNSDPFIVSLFMRLLRFSYSIDESKFRCTIQCRADQNTKELEEFWFETINIPKSQFYKTQIDPRTIGKPSRKPNYKGVCRIDYFSSTILNELMEIINIIK